MKSSVRPTEMLALVILPASRLALMKLSTSGCQTLRINIRAPRLDPPCSIHPVTKGKSPPQETEPLGRPLTPFTYAWRGRSEERLIPTTPPRDMISISCESVCTMPRRAALDEG